MADEFPIDQARLPMWVLYDHPNDFPDYIVARLWHSLPKPEATSICILSPDVDALRLYFEKLGCTVIPRSETDDPVIIESWMV